MADFDLAIVGAGPVGLYAAYYAGFRGLRTVVIDALPVAGGQISAMYPEKEIFDVAGFASVRGQQLVEQLVEQASRYEPRFVLGDPLLQLEDGEAGFSLKTATGNELTARRVLATTGLGQFRPRPLPGVPDEMAREVHHFVTRLSDLDRRQVVVVGGGDSAVDWALAAEPRAAATAIVHRRDNFRAHAGSVAAMRSSSVDVLTPGQVTNVLGEGRIESVVVDMPEGQKVVPCDFLIAALGFLSDNRVLESWGLEFDQRHVKVGPDMQTSRSGIYAAGDVSEYAGKVRLISVGFGEAAIAVNHIAASLDPAAQVYPGHSTHTGD